MLEPHEQHVIQEERHGHRGLGRRAVHAWSTRPNALYTGELQTMRGYGLTLDEPLALVNQVGERRRAPDYFARFLPELA